MKISLETSGYLCQVLTVLWFGWLEHDTAAFTVVDQPAMAGVFFKLSIVDRTKNHRPVD